jgi:hypothetical protein
MIAGALLFLSGIMMFCTGLLGEILVRTYFESQGRRIYASGNPNAARSPSGRFFGSISHHSQRLRPSQSPVGAYIQ